MTKAERLDENEVSKNSKCRESDVELIVDVLEGV